LDDSKVFYDYANGTVTALYGIVGAVQVDVEASSAVNTYLDTYGDPRNDLNPDPMGGNAGQYSAIFCADSQGKACLPGCSSFWPKGIPERTFVTYAWRCNHGTPADTSDDTVSFIQVYVDSEGQAATLHYYGLPIGFWDYLLSYDE
jgi:hypothetical protein